MVGPPGSGRSTQAAILKKDLGMAVISADEVIARNPQKFQKNRIPTLQGVDPHLDPALNELVEEALKSTDLSKGVVLDGYPASKIQGDFLTGLRENQLPRAIVIHLSVPDDEVRKRLKSQNGRDIEQELKDYHREFDFIRTVLSRSRHSDRGWDQIARGGREADSQGARQPAEVTYGRLRYLHWQNDRPLRGAGEAWRRRNGRGVPGAGHGAPAIRRHQVPAR